MRLLLTVVTLVALVQDTPTVTVSHEYYDIWGSTVRALLWQISRHGPEGPDGNRYAAFTDWEVTWHYQRRESENECRVERASVTLRVVITLPRWRNRESAPALLGEKWQRYLDALQVHEAGHLDFAVRAATEIRQQLVALEPLPTCEELEARVNTTCEAILRSYWALETAYDSTTNHGVTQGAILR